MNHPNNLPHRSSIRLQGYDYSQAGAYFVTICTQGRACLFGDIKNGAMVLNEYGCAVRDEWLKISEIRAEIQTGEFVVMPNHFHGIVIIAEPTIGAIRELPLRQFRRGDSWITHPNRHNDNVGAIHDNQPLGCQKTTTKWLVIVNRPYMYRSCPCFLCSAVMMPDSSRPNTVMMM